MSDYLPDVKEYAPLASDAPGGVSIKYCGIAVRNADSSMVSVSDDKERATVRDGFAAKKLGLAPDAATKGIQAVAEKMKDEKRKSRVTFYYLLAEATGTLGKLA